MIVDSYLQQAGQQIAFSRQQASDFAKHIADDFNPLHDIDNKRFCVPGDLLFSVVLAKYGVSQHMQFGFSGMVTDSVQLTLPAASAEMALQDSKEKVYLTIERSGDNNQQAELIDSLTRSYVSFSGKTFPHILVPLLEQQQVMINPARPMVIYERMLIELQTLACQNIELALDQARTRLETNGKRGNVRLAFNLLDNGKVVGQGEKHMVLSGLLAFDKVAMDDLVKGYTERKQNYFAAR